MFCRLVGFPERFSENRFRIYGMKQTGPHFSLPHAILIMGQVARRPVGVEVETKYRDGSLLYFPIPAFPAFPRFRRR